MELIDVYDLRVLDTDGESKVLAQQPNVCDRCGREHTIVYVVLDDEGQERSVGKTCCRRLFGWVPTPAEIEGLPYRRAGRKVGVQLAQRGKSFETRSQAWQYAQQIARRIMARRGIASWQFPYISRGIFERLPWAEDDRPISQVG